MTIRLLKEHKINEEIIPIDSVLDIEDEVANQLIAEGIAEAVQPEIVEIEQVETEKQDEDLIVEKAFKTDKPVIGLETKSFKATQTKAVAVTGDKKIMKGMLHKAITNTLETKAATTYAGTEATEILGIIGQEAQVFGKVYKRPITGNLNVVYSAANSNADAPVIGIVGEATAAATSVTMGEYAAIPAKWFCTVAIPSEMIDDVDGMEDFVSRELRNKLNIVLDNSVLNGTFTNNYGFRGIAGDSLAAKAEFAALATPTKAELQAMVAKINPAVLPSATWIMSPTFWAACVALLSTEANVAGQLYKDGKDKELFGYPVIVSVAANATNPVFFGSLDNYAAGIARDIKIEVDDSVNFNTDQKVVKISVRAAGGLAAGKQTFNSVAYASMAYGAVTAGQ